MTKEVMLSLLNRAATGNEMLAVIDGFSVNEPAELEQVDYQNSATLETIEF